MNKQEIDRLISDAEPFIGKDTMVNIGLKKSVNLKPYKFIKINMVIGFAENGGQYNYQAPTGILISEDGKERKPLLSKLIDCFKNNKPLERF